ncbi:Sir2 histone deacetylase Hst2 [Basidiobolus ranarum]|uniref:NAD-dependent protein deacetylase n=1 Tax=Basidiobolus ranarum TaxID=34480 RepID=A0ABR2WI40_9FUNG
MVKEKEKVDPLTPTAERYRDSEVASDSEDSDSENAQQYNKFLKFRRELNVPGNRLIDNPTIKAFSKLIKDKKVKKILVLTGAGISTSAGIPDFRSPDTGLYDNLQKFDLPYPEAIFDIHYFQKKPEPFYLLAKELYPGNFKPTLSHYFIRLLHEKGLLLRNFTQNIDTLERVAGLDADKIVEAHGSFNTAHCTHCEEEYEQEWVKDHLINSRTPRCHKCKGLVKPDIVFFGEQLPDRFFTCAKEDFKNCDMLIVMGTSLQVQPFASLIDQVSSKVPRLLINREICGVFTGTRSRGFDFEGVRQQYQRDALYLGSCDDGSEKLAELLGWKTELSELREAAIASFETAFPKTPTPQEKLADIAESLTQEFQSKANI